jgi:hypothetical protein
VSDREVVVTYSIRAGSGNRGVFENIAKGAADIQNAYTRAGDVAAKHAEQMARRIETAYSKAARSIAGSVAQRVTATVPQFVMPLSPQQQAASRAQANGGTGVSQFLEDAATRRATRAPKEGGNADERAAKQAQAAQNKRTIDILKQQEREAVNAERMAERKARADERAAAIATRAAEKEARDKERASQRAAAAAERASERIARAAEKQAKDQERASERAATAAERAAQREQRDQNKRTVDILKQQERDAANAERTADQQASRSEQQRERFSGGARKAFQGTVSAVEGVAYLGLSSEDDTQKLIEGVMEVRGAAMGLVGVVDAVDGVMRAMGAVRAIAVGGAVAETALAAARTRTAAATGAAAVAEGGRAAAGAAGGIAGRVLPGVAGGAAAAGGGSAAGFALSAITGIGGLLASLPMAIAGAVASTAAAGAMVTNVGGSRDWAAGKMSKSGWLDPGTIGGSAFGGRMALFSGYSAVEHLATGDSTYARQRRAEAGQKAVTQNQQATAQREQEAEDAHQQFGLESVRDEQLAELGRGGRDRAVETRYRRAGLIPGRQVQLAAARGGVEDTQTALSRAQERYQELQRQSFRGLIGGQQVGEAGQDIASAQQQARVAQERQAKEAQQARLIRAQAIEQQSTAQKEAQAARSTLAGLEAKQSRFKATGLFDGQSGAGVTQAVQENERQVEQARQRAAEATERETAATRNRLQVEQQISQEKIRAAETSVAKAKEEVQYHQQIADAARGRLQSGQERFGQMNPVEQKRAIDLMEQARTKGTAGMHPEQLAFLRGIGGDAEETVKAEYMKRGEAFQEHFGTRDRGLLAQSQAAKQKAEIALKDQRELKVNVERDDESIATRLAEEISMTLKERDQILIGKVMAMFKQGEQQLGKQRQEASVSRESMMKPK